MKKMTHTVQCTIPAYIKDPDYKDSFINAIKRVSGYPIEITGIDYGEVDVCISEEQADEIRNISLVRNVKSSFGNETYTKCKYLTEDGEITIDNF